MQNHRCPLIPEIVTHIFKNLLDDSEYSSLCQLARTTKSFTEPALDLLWRSQSSLAPLVCCLPDDAIYKIHYEKDYGLIVSVSNCFVTLLLMHARKYVVSSFLRIYTESGSTQGGSGEYTQISRV